MLIPALNHPSVSLPDHWDAIRYAEAAKTFRVGMPQTENERSLAQAFPSPELGHLTEPTMVLDTNGIILLVYLPGIMPTRLVVCRRYFFFAFCAHFHCRNRLSRRLKTCT